MRLHKRRFSIIGGCDVEKELLTCVFNTYIDIIEPMSELGINCMVSEEVMTRLENEVGNNYPERIRDVWELHIKELNRIIKRLPTHYKYLLNNIYN